MTVWGIDPGSKGALAIVGFNPFWIAESALVHPIRSSDHRVIPDDWKAWLSIHGKPDLAVVERVSGAGANHWGSGASFSFGKIVGSTLTMLDALGIPIMEVHPRSWKSVMVKGSDKSKKQSILSCQQLFPNVSLVPVGKRVPSHDYAESLLIAHYGYQKHKGLIP